MVESSRRLIVLDAFRVPYDVVPDSAGGHGTGRLRSSDGLAELVWIEPRGGQGGSYMIDGIPVFGTLASEDELLAAFPERTWREDVPILDEHGEQASAIWRASDGSVLLPFDPDEVVFNILSERYLSLSAGGGRKQAIARSAYYRLRPLLPRRVQIALRRRFMRVQERRTFPRWPLEPALHQLYTLLLGLAEDVVGEPLPWIEPWPDGRSWALVLTHDVERKAGYDFIDRVLVEERSVGVRSAWYFVPERDYTVGEERVLSLVAEGFEVGLHGLRHDGRDLSHGTFEERLPAMLEYARRWGAVGFRSPATHRDWALMPKLGLDYDSSYSDIARYEPIPGGSCSWLPFFIDDLVELPITMPMDHTLFELERETDERQWLAKAASLKQEGGMSLLLTHPDYLLVDGRLAVYRRFLEATASDPGAWLALPREVSAWWRARAAMTPVHTPAGWAARGPSAHRARVAVGVPRRRQ